MIDAAELQVAWLTLQQMLHDAWHAEWREVATRFFPFVMLFEMPVQAAVMLGACRYWWRNRNKRSAPRIAPRVTCIITCYSEGDDVKKTIASLTEQLYPGQIDMLAIVDGAHRNKATADAVQAMLAAVKHRPMRSLELVAKTQRGGRVSSLNQGLALARGEIVLALDGDTSFDNDMVRNVV